MWKLLQKRFNSDRKASELYGRVVAQARQPEFYARMGVPDTPEGRYELVVLHLSLTVDRLCRTGAPGHRLARALNERFVVDMDDNLREMGVGDMVVPKKVKRAAAGLLERAERYRGAFEIGGGEMLHAALVEHIPSLAEGVDGGRDLLSYAEAAHRMLAEVSDADVLAGQVRYPTA